MNKTEVNAKLQYVFERLPLSRVQKQMLGDVISTIIETAVEGVEKPELAAAYLAGFVGQRMYPKAKHFLCKCHC